MRLKRWLYGLPIMSGYRGMRTRNEASRHRDHKLGFRFAGGDNFFGDFEPPETALIERELGNADVFIDVGANVGLFACLAASRGKVVAAVEPEPGNLNFLMSNVDENDFAIEVYPVAVGDRVGVLKLYGDAETASAVPAWFGNDPSFVQRVPSNRLDNLFAERWSGKRLFIKIDVEGFEENVLDGATRLLQADPKPKWMIECLSYHLTEGRPRNDFFVPLFERMFAAGYQAVSIDTGETLDIEAVKHLQDEGIKSSKDVRFNFFFEDRSLSA